MSLRQCRSLLAAGIHRTRPSMGGLTSTSASITNPMLGRRYHHHPSSLLPSPHGCGRSIINGTSLSQRTMRKLRPGQGREYSSTLERRAKVPRPKPQPLRQPLIQSLPPPETGQEVLDEQNNSIPKWPAVASILTVIVMFTGWGVSQWMFGNRQLERNERLRRQFVAEYYGGDVVGGDDERQKDGGMTAEVKLHSRPTLFHCVVRRDVGFDHCMGGKLRVGDVVDVLEEGVGPDRMYNLCRLPADPTDGLAADMYGWFPIRWLQKYDHYLETVQRHQQQEQEQMAQDGTGN